MKESSVVKRSSAPRVTNGLEFTDHYFDLPLDYSLPDGEKIIIFAREVALKDASENYPSVS